jgi:hypothetical protein
MPASKQKTISENQRQLAVENKTDDLLTTSAQLLSEVNEELDTRFMDLPKDVRALLVQKGALTQTIIRELIRLIEKAADKAEKHEALLDHCEEWQREFFIPLKAQSDGEAVKEAIYLKDLEEMIEEVGRVLAERSNS